MTNFTPSERKAAASEKTVRRLSLYRRLLYGMLAERVDHVYSHQLAASAGLTPAQVRRDVMVTGYSGTPTRGYDVRGLIDSISSFLDDPKGQAMALVGVGNLGRAVLAYFAGRRPNLTVGAAFDRDPNKTGRVIQGCRCYRMEELEDVLRREGIQTAILSVPADQAQPVADRLIQAGVRGIVNFAPVRLRVPEHVYVDNMDITTALETAAYFARRGTPDPGD